MPLRSDLQAARPADPFLRFRLDERSAGPAIIDGDHIGVVRTGRRSGEVWITALGDDPVRVLALIDALSAGRTIDGIHVVDDVYPELPERLRIPDPGWWSIWTVEPGALVDPSSDMDVVCLDPHDERIDPLLKHSDSAYLFAGSDEVRRWMGIVDGDRLLAVAGEATVRGDVPHLVSICVDPQRRGEGLGRRVTAHLAAMAIADGASEVYLEMYAGNTRQRAPMRASASSSVAATDPASCPAVANRLHTQ